MQGDLTDQDGDIRAGGGGQHDGVRALAGVPGVQEQTAVFGNQEGLSTGTYCEGSGNTSRQHHLLQQAGRCPRGHHLLGTGYSGRAFPNGHRFCNQCYQHGRDNMGALQRIHDSLNLHQVPQWTRQVQSSPQPQDSPSQPTGPSSAVPNPVGLSRDGQVDMGHDEGVASGGGDLPEDGQQQVVGWLPSDPQVHHHRRGDARWFRRDERADRPTETAIGRKQQRFPGGDEGVIDVDQPTEGDSDQQLRSSPVVQKCDRGLWVAETYRRFAKKSGTCPVCGLPYVFCTTHEPDDNRHMEGGLSDPGSARDMDYLATFKSHNVKVFNTENERDAFHYLPNYIRNVSFGPR